MPRPSVVTGVQVLIRTQRRHRFRHGWPVRTLDGNGDLGEAFLLDAFGVTQRGAAAVREPDGFILRHGHVHAGRGVTDGLG